MTSLQLNNGRSMPIIGLGTWKSQPSEVYETVKFAIQIGYRHIDCAMIYQNEAEVGKALKDVIAEGTVKREELFITSKVWNTFHRKERVVDACKKSLEDLGLEYLDLYLIHWPMSFKDGDDLFPKNDKGQLIFENIDVCDKWQGMEDCCKAGFSKSIGLSNFNSQQIKKVLDSCEIKPSVLQIESHPYLNQNKVIDFCKKHDIAVTAYRPLGSPGNPGATSEEPNILKDLRIKKIAENHNKTEAQILIRFQIQRAVIVIPKSVTKDRILSNFEVFDFELTEEEMNNLSNFGIQYRLCSNEKLWGDAPNFPFSIEY